MLDDNKKVVFSFREKIGSSIMYRIFYRTVFLVMVFMVLSISAFGQGGYATQSVLATGTWYKMGLDETGMYKITYSDLKALGVNVSDINPQHIRIYHNGGGVLPELNRESRYDDLQEIPIFVSGEEDGRFDQNDYILFYGRGPVTWKYNTDLEGMYEHVQNAYDDYAYAFMTTSLGTGKRIETEAEPLDAPSETVSLFLDRIVHERDEYNFNNMGRSYYGDVMDSTSLMSFNFKFPNAELSKPCKLAVALAGRNYSTARFTVLVDDRQVAVYPVASTKPNGTCYANAANGKVSTAMTGDDVKLTLNYSSVAGSTAIGYVDYLIVNAWRKLVFVGPQMAFRNPDASQLGKVYEYRLSNVSSNVQVWNVTDPVAPHKIKGTQNGTTLSFKERGSIDNEFVAFDGTSYLSVTNCGQVVNQNLHGIRDVEYLIIAHPDFLSQAERLKAIHAVQDPDVTSYVTTPQAIYNEFACGAVDVTAIRDFCRMLYQDSERPLRYLLLFGDASYDYKNRGGKTVCFVPAYETVASLDMEKSFVTDDYFGCFDINEGDIGSSLADIGIGRFPVSTVEQATQMVDKVENYIAQNANTMKPWRNVVTFVTDDERDFTLTAESLFSSLEAGDGSAFVYDKIYLDAYEQVSTPNGVLAPSVNEAINNRMEKGTLVMNYIGHGGEVQLCEERIMQRKDVDSWRNAPMYPLMITATCEFSRYDDHNRTSLGEYAFLNQYGGMIAMFTTSRVTYRNDNKAFNEGIYAHLFGLENGNSLPLGDVYRMAKTTGKIPEKRYVFFGDPLLRLAYAKWSVETERINGSPMGVTDTIRALQPVEIEGVVKDLTGQLAADFNGIVYVTVYDKVAHLTTAGSDNAPPVAFDLRNSMVFNGQTSVENGRFKIQFIVPRDISYSYGSGMISYYATNYEVDAKGRFEDFVIGGFYEDAENDVDAPEIDLFIDDVYFVSGGLTGESPTLLAFVEDESGINTTGTGIGHDIIATLTGADEQSYCLNDYFVSEPNQPGKGTITYKMLNLSEGDYTLTLKVWDIYNNSNTASIDFKVVNSQSMQVEQPYNMPNPVVDMTYFTFDHNQIGNNMDVQIDIYDIMGRHVTRISKRIMGVSTRVEPIPWDGRTQNGTPLSNGVYVYRIIATNDKGETAVCSSKLIISK